MTWGPWNSTTNPSNYFAEVEQAAFSPANGVPGIGHSPDKMLQFRIISYAAPQRYRLGVNHESLDVNRPRCPMHNYHRAGQMRMDTADRAPNYEPNSFGGPVEGAAAEPALLIDGSAARYDHRDGNDDYTQAGNLFRLMPADEQQRLVASIVGAMRNVPESIQRRQVEHYRRADPAYGEKAWLGASASWKRKQPAAMHPLPHAGAGFAAALVPRPPRCLRGDPSASEPACPFDKHSDPVILGCRLVSSSASRNVRIESNSETQMVDGGTRWGWWSARFRRNGR